MFLFATLISPTVCGLILSSNCDKKIFSYKSFLLNKPFIYSPNICLCSKLVVPNSIENLKCALLVEISPFRISPYYDKRYYEQHWTDNQVRWDKFLSFPWSCSGRESQTRLPVDFRVTILLFHAISEKR